MPRPSISWLLLFVPLAAALDHWAPERGVWIFACACIAVVPLAGWMGRATEQLAARTGEGVGGLLNATFGNAAELVLALVALQSGLVDVVKASLTGSILGNLLLVLGAACLAGGLRHRELRFNASAARSMSTMLLLAAIGFVAPAAFHLLGRSGAGTERHLSLEISLVLLLCYALSLVFSLGTHRQLFVGDAAAAAGVHEAGHRPWTLRRSVATLAAATLGVVWMSEILVGSIETAAERLGMTPLFVGIVVVAIVGNAAEHSTAILVARRNRMDLALGITIGSSIQIALFVAPVLVLASYAIGPRPIDLVFTPAEVLAVVVAVAITAQVAGDGESHWLEGAQLIAVYLILALVFYFLPAATGPALPIAAD
jgi:Ca2+:H+ antiporter